MRTRALSLIVAGLVVVAAFVLFRIVGEVYIDTFQRHPGELNIVIAPALVATSIYLLRRRWGLAAWTLLIGSAAFFMVFLYEVFAAFAITYDWFSVSVADAWLLPGRWQPREHPLIATLRYLSLATWAGIFWVAALAVERHLTRRSSEPRASLRPTL